jgi:hypothetical protein
MKTFIQFLAETKESVRPLQVFDIDGTVFDPNAKVRVLHGNKLVDSLNHEQFNTHKLPKGHRYDFSEFRSAEKFAESKPKQRMLHKLRTLHSKTKQDGGKVIINTARADFDDKEKFLDVFRKHNVDIDDIHVHRAGNIDDDGTTTIGERKANIIRNHLETGDFTHVSLYDDGKENLDHFLALKKEFPHIHFNAHHVKPDGKSKRYTG